MQSGFPNPAVEYLTQIGSASRIVSLTQNLNGMLGRIDELNENVLQS